MPTASAPLAYPAFLESFWTTHAILATGVAPDKEDARETALRRLEPKVQALSDLFTGARPGEFPDYFADRSLLAAYGVFFFPQSFAKARFVLARAMDLRGWKPAGQAVRILDLGAGAGPCGLGLALLLRERFPQATIHLTALDHSPHALAALRETAKLPEFSGWLTLDVVRHDLKSGVLPAVGAPHDLVVAGFALNEIFAARGHEERVTFLKHLRRLLAPAGLMVLLEPAFKPTAEPLTRAADALASGPEFFRWGPQLSGDPCPFLADAQSKYWDHEVRRWTAPDALEFLNRRLFRDISTLKFSCALLGATPPPAFAAAPEGRALLRLAGPMTPLKGRFVVPAITDKGQLVTVQIPTRGMARKDEKAFEERFERGDLVTCSWEPLAGAGMFKAEAESLKPL